MSDETRQGTTVEDAASGVLTFLKTVRKHWPVVVASIVMALAIGVLYTKTQKPIYEASAMVEFTPEVVRPLGNKDDMGDMMGFWDHQEYYETQYKIITSNRVLLRVVRDLGLPAEPAFKASHASPEDIADSLRGQIKIDPVKNSRLVWIHIDDPDPKRARRLAEAVANAYIAQNLDKSVQATSDAVVWLNGQVDQYKGALDSDENALHDFKERNDLPSTSINDASNMVRLEMQQFNEAVNHSKTKEQELLARYAELSKVSADNPDDLPESELLGSVFLQQLRAQYQQAKKDRAALIAEGKGENHPLVKSATDRLEQARASLLREVKNIQGAVGHDLAAVQHQKAGDTNLFEESRKRAVDLNMKEIEYHRLDRSRQEDEKIYGMLLERMKETDLQRMMNVNNVRLVDAPTEPRAPIKPRMSTNLAASLALGLILGLAFAWVRDQLDSSIKTPDDVEQRLGVTFLGLLPSVDDEDGDEPGAPKKRRRRRVQPAQITGRPELVVHDRPLSGLAEAARAVRTNLLFMNPDRPHRTLLVSSAAPSEGKTTVACSIAIALAQGGQRVCIIDCDLRRPRLHRIFDRVGNAGVTNVLLGDAGVDDVIKPTEIGNLWSIPSGPIPPNPADVLHSERFKKFLKDVAERFDRVVIDSPPLVPVTDAAVLSTLVDGTIYVLRAFRTSRQLAGQGLRALRDVDAPVVGAVLNAVNLNSHEYNYYYHYYYYKREGYAPRAPGPDDESGERASSASPH